jgi:DbpA RNA binding domain.
MEIEKIIESIQSTINSNDLSEYTSELETIEKELTTLGEQYSSQTISAAILKMYTDFKNKEAEKKAKQDAKVASDAEKATKESNVQRFFINVGMMDNLDKDSLMKLIMDNVEGVKDTDFTDVYLKDSFSFFELPKTYSDAVLAKLVGLKVGEREVNVELSEKKERSSSRGGRSSYRGGHRDSYGDRGGHRSFSHRDSYGDRGGDRGDYGDRRSYSHRDDSRSSYRHNDDRSYSRSNDDMGGYAKENPGSYTESKHGRFSRDSKPRGGYSRKKY